jgi:hypothetical protein
VSLLASSSLSSAYLHHPSTGNLFDESSLSSNFYSTTLSTMNSSDTTTVNQSHDTTFSLNEADLAALFVSSLMTTTPSPSLTTAIHDNNNKNATSMNAFNDVFLSHLTDLACTPSSSLIDSHSSIEPPPGFESFRFDTSATSDLLLSQTATNQSHISSMNATNIERSVSSSDTINFSQLLQSTSAVGEKIEKCVRKIDSYQHRQSYMFRSIRKTSIHDWLCWTDSFFVIISLTIYIR